MRTVLPKLINLLAFVAFIIIPIIAWKSHNWWFLIGLISWYLGGATLFIRYGLILALLVGAAYVVYGELNPAHPKAIDFIFVCFIINYLLQRINKFLIFGNEPSNVAELRQKMNDERELRNEQDQK